MTVDQSQREFCCPNCSSPNISEYHSGWHCSLCGSSFRSPSTSTFSVVKQPTDTTSRGFKIKEFVDTSGVSCSIQESSIADDDRIWFGVKENRMHLNRKQVKKLLPLLKHFAKHGNLPDEIDW